METWELTLFCWVCVRACSQASRGFELHCPVGLFGSLQQSSDKLDEKETSNFEQRSKFELAVGVVEALPGTPSQTFTNPPHEGSRWRLRDLPSREPDADEGGGGERGYEDVHNDVVVKAPR